ncbi:restriction endonuclease subunit S [Flavitalea flava]
MKDDNLIPDNWETVKIEDIALKIHYGYTESSTKTNTGIKFLRITDIQDYKVNWSEVPYCKIDPSDANKYLLEEGDLLFARTGATVGKSFLIQGKIPKSIFASYLIRIILSKHIYSKYVFYFFQSADYWKQIGVKAVGIGQPNVNGKLLANITLPLASNNEQKKIVEKIEEIFSDLDQAELAYLKILSQLKVYRQSVLNSAFSGDLTEDWRNANNSIISSTDYLKKVLDKRKHDYEKLIKDKKKTRVEKKHYDFSYNQNDKIPTWATAKLDGLITIAARIGWKGLKKEEYTKKGPLFLSVHCLNYGKYVAFKDAYHINEMRYEESPEIQLKNNDILLCKDGAGIGKIGMIRQLPYKATVNSSLLIIRGNEIFIPDFLYYLFKGPQLQAIVSERISGSAIPHLFQKDIKEFILNIPPIVEQQQIVQEIEYRFTIADNLENTIKINQQRAQTFRQIILKNAFKGKLIERHTSSESAHSLLEKITIEKDFYMSIQKITPKKKPNKKKVIKDNISIMDILKNASSPLPADEVWLQSEHKDNIENFYAALKQIQNEVTAVKKGTQSLLSLKNENR